MSKGDVLRATELTSDGACEGYVTDRSKHTLKMVWQTWKEGGERVAHYGPLNFQVASRTACGESLPFFATVLDELDVDPELCEACREAAE